MGALKPIVPRSGDKAKKLFIDILIDLGLLVIGSFLFFLAFPNFISIDGLFSPIAFIAIIPVFIVVHRCGWVRVFIYGAFYGYITYVLFNYWLVTFSRTAIIIVPLIYAIYFLILFPSLKLIDMLFPDHGYIFQAFAWIGYEYLRTQGYLGYAYGIIGYSQYLFLPLARIASLTGVWGVSFLIVFPQSLIANCFKNGIKGFFTFFKKQFPAIIVFAGLFAGALVYGFLTNIPQNSLPEWRVALIQQNSDPWKDTYESYDASLDSLITLSKKSLDEKPDIVIWSETAFVPAIEYHLKYRELREAVVVVQKLMDFLDTQEVPYVVGNDEGVKIKEGTDRETRIDYNAALLFNKSKLVQGYRKLHLVPFTEHFPYKDIFQFMYDWLVAMDTHFWEQGTEYTVFDTGKVKFSTPICFEDTFGYLSRRFVNRGADVLVNLTNDTWSGSEVSEVQHMAMAVFRAIENQRPIVRSANSGITCVIDSNGKIVKRIPAFTAGYLVADVPVYRKGVTPYGLWEDSFAVVLLLLALCGIVFGLVRRLTVHGKKRIDKTG